MGKNDMRAPLRLARHVTSHQKRLFSSSSPAIPVIDLAPFLDGSDKAAVAAELGAACEKIGFFAVSNHGVPDEVIDNAWGQTRAFFDLDAETKVSMGLNMDAEYPYGYIPLSGETLSAGKQAETGDEGSQAPPDLNESFSIGPYTTEFGAPPVKWPTQPAGFRDAWLAYYQGMERLSADLLRVFALSPDLPEM